MASGTPLSKATLERKFRESGESERMKELLLQRLRESGWMEEVENMCREVIQQRGIEQVTLEEVVAEVKGPARRVVPEDVKKEIMRRIRSFLRKEAGLKDMKDL